MDTQTVIAVCNILLVIIGIIEILEITRQRK